MIEGIDYFVRVVEFPNYASPVCVTPNDDGTYSVYANARYTMEQIKNSLPHELVHMENNHFADERTISEIEKEADSAEPKSDQNGGGAVACNHGR